MNNPIPIKNIDFKKIQVSNNFIIKNNKKIIKLKYNNSRFIVQTPELFFKKNIIAHKNILEFIIPILCSDQSKNTLFKNFLTNMDNFIVNCAKQKQSTWFNPSAKVKYKSLVRQYNNGDDIYNNGIFKIKMKKKNNVKITSEMQTESIDLNTIPILSKVKLAFEFFGIWINENSFGLYIKPLLLDFRYINNIDFTLDSDDSYDDILETEFNGCNTINRNHDEQVDQVEQVEQEEQEEQVIQVVQEDQEEQVVQEDQEVREDRVTQIVQGQSNIDDNITSINNVEQMLNDDSITSSE